MKLRILVRPGRDGSFLSPAEGFEKGRCDFTASLVSRPQGGAANRELLRLLEEKFGGKPRIIGGLSGRTKLVEISADPTISSVSSGIVTGKSHQK